MTTLLLIVTCIVFIKAQNITCESNKDCIINCNDTTLYGSKGCYSLTIDGSRATSLSVSCLSVDPFNGGCQFSKILCPSSQSSSSLCNVNCGDYYSCYLSTINASANTTSLNVHCADEENSCSRTIIYANNSNTVNVSCEGSAILTSTTDAACSEMDIYAQNVKNQVNLKCDGDFACSYVNLQATTANAITVYSRGKEAMYYGSIHGENSNSLDIFCGSEESEYGCYYTSFYLPSYSNQFVPRANIYCEGHGCYSNLNIYSINGALDLDISLNGCRECQSADECISSWTFYCGSSYSDYIAFYGEECSSSTGRDLCECKTATNNIQSNFINTNSKCDIFEADYICPAGKDCTIDCSTQFKDGCFDKYIDATNATYLLIKCNAPKGSNFGGCESSHIYCPEGNDCHVECNETKACDNMELNTNELLYGLVNLTCIEKDSCSGTAVYATNTDYLFINCIETDACYQVGVYGNNAKNISITCEGDATSTSYSSCYDIQVYANFSEHVMIDCDGDHACYSIDVEAYYANELIIRANGEDSVYNGIIHGDFINYLMKIVCISEYQAYGCRSAAFYLPSNKTDIECKGHGCRYLTLYAENGYDDIKSVSWNGCGECTSFSDCLYDWQMYCNPVYSYDYTRMYATYCSESYSSYGYTCGCDDFRQIASNSFSNTVDKTCDLFDPDIECESKDAPDCVKKCTNTECYGKVIGGGNEVSSMSVECKSTSSCYNAKIICPTKDKSQCNVTCSGSSSCYGLDIFGSAGGIINVECNGQQGQSTCASMTIYGEDADQINFVCSSSSCQNSVVYATNANNIDVSCTDTSTSSYPYYSSRNCYQMNIYGKYIKDTAEILCDGYYACYDANFYLNNATNVVLSAEGYEAFYSGTMTVTDSSFSNISCIGSSSSYYGCYDAVFHIDPEKTQLNCIGYGCYYIYFYSDSDFSGLEDITFDGANYCSSVDYCVYRWYLYGSGSTCPYSTYFYGASCSRSYDDCGCSDLTSITQRAWYNAHKVTCKNGQDCKYTCDGTNTNCQYGSIDASNASSLSVTCSSSSYSCSSAVFYCPLKSGSDCDVTCSSSYSCQGLEIRSYTDNNINIKCSYYGSCKSMKVYANTAESVNLKCYGYASSSSYGSCYQLVLYGSSANSVKVSCAANYACYDATFSLNNAHNVNLIASSYSDALYSADVTIQNVSFANITCDASSYWYGCYDATLRIKPENTQLNCIGYGCYYLYLYSATDFSDLKQIEFDGNGYCSSVDYCVNDWYLHGSYSLCGSSTTFYGASCSRSYSDCGCSDLISITNKAWYNSNSLRCKDGVSCSYNCDGSTTKCQYGEIDGQNASSLAVSCGYYGCDNALLYCPTESGSDCNITCTSTHACYGLKVQSDTDNNINIKCSYSSSCGTIKIYANNAKNVNLECNGYGSSYSYGACYSSVLNALSADSVNVNCDNKYACYDAEFNLNNAKSVTLTAGAYYEALYSSSLTAQNVSFANITCIGYTSSYYYYSCYDATFTINPAVTHLNCVGYGCYYLLLHAITDFEDFKEITFDGDGACSSVDNCVNYWYLYGSYSSCSSYTAFYGASCSRSSSDCGCSHLISITNKAWYNSRSVQCKNGVACTYNCDGSNTKCQYGEIDAQNASSLSLSCGYYGCSSAILYCPIESGSDCNIVCSSTHACYGLEIHSSTDNNINIKCSYSTSCGTIKIYANNAKSVNLECNGYGTSYSYGACYYASLNALSANSVNINCNNKYACYHATFNLNNAHSVTLTAGAYYDAVYAASLTAQNVSFANITCIGNKGYTSYYGCYDATFKINPEVTHLNCIGYGCYYLYLYAITDFKNFNGITFDGDGACTSVDYCVHYWYLKGSGSTCYDTTFYGAYCSRSYSDCGCSEIIQITSKAWYGTTTNPTTYSYSTTMEPTLGLVTRNPTLNPTKEPTTKEPTANPSRNPTLKPTPAPAKEPTPIPTETNEPTANPTTKEPTSSHVIVETTSHFIATSNPTNNPAIDPSTVPQHDTQDDNNTQLSLVEYIIITAAATAFVLICCMLIGCCIHRRRKRRIPRAGRERIGSEEQEGLDFHQPQITAQYPSTQQITGVGEVQEIALQPIPKAYVPKRVNPYMPLNEENEIQQNED